MGTVCTEKFYLVQLLSEGPFSISKSAEQVRDTDQNTEFEILTQFKQKATVLTFEYKKRQSCHLMLVSRALGTRLYEGRVIA